MKAIPKAEQQPLAGCKVLLTRPEGEVTDPCRWIAATGGNSRHIPVLSIAPPDRRLRAKLQQLSPWSTELRRLIFISAHAVQHSKGLLYTATRPMPPALRCYAVGPVTAEAMRAQGLEPILPDNRNWSAAGLAALPELQRLEGQRVLIVRGVGGNPTLMEQLRARGADIRLAEVYRRLLPSENAAPLQAALASAAVNTVLVQSGQSLKNLCELAGAELPQLLRLPICVGSPSIAATARQHGFTTVWVAAAATDEALFAALTAHWTPP